MGTKHTPESMYVKRLPNGDHEYGRIEYNFKNRSRDRMIPIGTKRTYEEAYAAIAKAGA